MESVKVIKMTMLKYFGSVATYISGSSLTKVHTLFLMNKWSLSFGARQHNGSLDVSATTTGVYKTQMNGQN